MYFEGSGVEKSSAEAAVWFHQAAEQRVEFASASAQLFLGWMYETGEGIEKNMAKAVIWYREAAEMGYCCYEFDLCYVNDGHSLDMINDSIFDFQEAAEQGDPIAQFKLGMMYNCGHGVGKDFSKAVAWYRKAAEQGDAVAQSCLGRFHIKGEGVEKDLAEAIRWYRMAAEQECIGAQLKLGKIYEVGQGVEKDLVEAIHWFRKAAFNGLWTTHFKIAPKILRLTAERGEANAQVLLGECYLVNEGMEIDLAKATNWFQKAAEQGHVVAMVLLIIHAKGSVDKYMWTCLYGIYGGDDWGCEEFLRPELNPEQIAGAETKARKFHRKIEARNQG